MVGNNSIIYELKHLLALVLFFTYVFFLLVVNISIIL